MQRSLSFLLYWAVKGLNRNKIKKQKGMEIMIIVVASSGGMVSQHFGHSEGFELYEVEDSSAKTSRYIASPGHGKASLPGLLIKEGAQVLLTGGLGEGAMARLAEGGISVITGVAGRTDEAVRRYLSGDLVSSDTLCKGHDHTHEHAHESHHNCGGQGGC